MKKMEMMMLAAALCLAAGAAQAEDLVFTLKNGTNSVLNNFYASPVGVENWEDDIFGRQALGPGETMEIDANATATSQGQKLGCSTLITSHFSAGGRRHATRER